MPTDDDEGEGAMLRRDSEKLMFKGFRLSLDVPTQNVRPLGDRLVLRIEDDVPQTAGLLTLPQGVKVRLRKGTVIRNCDGPHPTCPPIPVGTQVVYHELGGAQFNTATDTIRIIRHQDVLAILDEAGQ